MLRYLIKFAAACLLLLPDAAPTRLPPDSRSDPPLVAIIDAGIARTPELARLLVAEYDLGSRPARPPFQPRYDHGTMVATILARAAGGRVRIVSFRIDDPAGCPAHRSPPCQPEGAPIAAAIRQATRMGVNAINISLTLAKDPAIVAAVRDAASHGILVVMAAGNEGMDHPGNLAMARAGFPNTMLVGALDSAGHPWRGTNRPLAGKPLGYAYSWQRGVDVPTIGRDGKRRTGTGTSFATPIETARLLAQRGQRIAMRPGSRRTEPS